MKFYLALKELESHDVKMAANHWEIGRYVKYDQEEKMFMEYKGECGIVYVPKAEDLIANWDIYSDNVANAKVLFKNLSYIQMLSNLMTLELHKTNPDDTLYFAYHKDHGFCVPVSNYSLGLLKLRHDSVKLITYINFDFDKHTTDEYSGWSIYESHMFDICEEVTLDKYKLSKTYSSKYGWNRSDIKDEEEDF